MNYILSILALALCFGGTAQTYISGKIINSETGEPVPYAYVKKKKINRGAITNEDGFFELACWEGDTLIVSFVSYQKLEVPYTYFLKNEVCYLTPADNELATVQVFADFEFLYDLFDQARKKLRQADNVSTKTWFSLETTTWGIPVELLECYYNAETGPSGINALDLKNGRIGMTSVDQTYFASLNTTQIISDYRLLSKRDSRFPGNPLQLSKKRLRKQYDLKLMAFEAGVYKIRFRPKKKTSGLFGAYIWIDKTSKQVARVDLFQNDVEKHPFVTIDANHKMDSLNFAISYTFSPDKRQTLDKIEFEYDLAYYNGVRNRTMESGGVFLFFEKDAAFDLPYYSETSHKLSDYDKIVSQPYNAGFWKYNEILSPSRKSLLYKEYFKKNGVLLNFDELSKHNAIFKNRIVQWSEKRLLPEDINQNGNYAVSRKNNGHHARLVSDYYELVGHIYLDRNVQGDSVYYLSRTLIDLESSFYYLEINKNTACILNIYYDLIEMERRNLEETLNSELWSKNQVDSIYQKSQAYLALTLKNFLADVEHGDKEVAVEKYCTAVKGNLGTDNALLIWPDHLAQVSLPETHAGGEPWIELYNHGTALLKIGKYEEALTILMRAYDLGSRDPWLLYNIGLNYIKLGKLKKGCEFLALSKKMGEEVPKELISECDFED